MKNDFYEEKTIAGNQEPYWEDSIKIPRSDKFLESAHKLSDFIAQLPLSREQNDKLISLITAQVLDAEEGGFRFGLKIGVEYGRSENDPEK